MFFAAERNPGVLLVILTVLADHAGMTPNVQTAKERRENGLFLNIKPPK
jgi:hypothetical protein